VQAVYHAQIVEATRGERGASLSMRARIEQARLTVAAKLAQYCAAGMPDFANRLLLKIRNGVAPTTCRGFDELCLDGDRLAGAVLARSFPPPGPAAPFFHRALHTTAARFSCPGEVRG
jgi:hypothetical protein